MFQGKCGLQKSKIKSCSDFHIIYYHPFLLTDMLHLVGMFAPKGLDSSQIHFIRLRKSALASLQSGNKKLALSYARELKLVTHSREKCSSLLSRVEEVLGVIADAESTKKARF